MRALLLVVALVFGWVAAAGAADGPIRVGLSMSLTGGLAAGGKSVLVGMQMWTEEANAKGGLLGRKVELVYYDDQSNPSLVPGIYAKLLDIDKVDLVVSPYGTNMTAAAMPIVMQREKLFVTINNLGISDKFRYDRFFHLAPVGPDAVNDWSRGFFDIAGRIEPKPRTVALVGADGEYSQTALIGARENAKALGYKIVYDGTYPPSTADFSPIIRAIQAANPDIVYLASYPLDTAGMLRSAREAGLKTKLFGGGPVGLQFAAMKQQLLPLIERTLYFSYYEPEPSLDFPGVKDFVRRYQERAVKEGVDPLGYYMPPLGYAAMQVIGQSVAAVGSLDAGKLAEHMHKTPFETILGTIEFGPLGEWKQARVLMVQLQDIDPAAGLDQFKQPGRAVVLAPEKFQSGTLRYPFQ